MARGPKKHLKRLNAPKHWMLSKMGGLWAPRPSTGPHKLRECLPIVLILRDRLKYALDAREVLVICQNRQVKIDGKVRTDPKFPSGFMDVVSLPKAGDNFRLMYDTKGRFVLHRITEEEAKYKLCKVTLLKLGAKKVPAITTHDGRTIRYPDPLIRVNDTAKIDIETGKVIDFIKFEIGNLVMITKGRNTGRVGVLTGRERHLGSFDIVQVKDSAGHVFATRLGAVFVIGQGSRPMVSLPKGKGIKLNIIEERSLREGKKA
jgi:ribosomal protein S4E